MLVTVGIMRHSKPGRDWTIISLIVLLMIALVAIYLHSIIHKIGYA